jgi:hypothetical protein
LSERTITAKAMQSITAVTTKDRMKYGILLYQGYCSSIRPVTYIPIQKTIAITLTITVEWSHRRPYLALYKISLEVSPSRVSTGLAESAPITGI